MPKGWEVNRGPADLFMESLFPIGGEIAIRTIDGYIVTKLLYAQLTEANWAMPVHYGAGGDVKYELIALLRKGSKHGYLLNEEIKKSVGLLQGVKAPQIYATLERLERDGLVAKERVRQKARPDRNVYNLTDRAEEDYRRWLTEPVGGPRRLKDEFFLKLFFAFEEGRSEAEGLLDAQEKALLQTLADLQALRSQAKKESNLKLFLLAEGAILHARADLKWLETFHRLVEERRERNDSRLNERGASSLTSSGRTEEEP